jgi:hypothetical protein
MCEMPTEKTVDLSVVPTATKCQRTKAVSAAICITVTASEPGQFQSNSHINIPITQHPAVLFKFSITKCPICHRVHKNYYSKYMTSQQLALLTVEEDA